MGRSLRSRGKFNIHTKLQCSKTPSSLCGRSRGFNIHTKLQCSKTSSNQWINFWKFNIHTKLQCSKTKRKRLQARLWFNIHTKLQCSKTMGRSLRSRGKFNIHTKLQCSKTRSMKARLFMCLISIRNYNALKHASNPSWYVDGLISIRNYNALKHASQLSAISVSLIPIRNYNALKRLSLNILQTNSLISIRNYNALKPQTEGRAADLSNQAIPYRLFTILYQNILYLLKFSSQQIIFFPYVYFLLKSTPSCFSRRCDKSFQALHNTNTLLPEQAPTPCTTSILRIV